MNFFVSMLAGAAALSSAAMAGASKDGEVFGDWKVSCAAGAPCQAFLGLKDQTTGRLLLSVSAHKAAGDKNPTMVVSLPLGLSLKDGVALLSGAADKAVLPARIDVCFPDGCRAVIELTPAALDALTASSEFEVRFIAYGAKDRVENVKIPSSGLRDALAQISR